NFSNNSVAVDIRGDQNFSNGGVADVGGGNDNISVKNFAAGATGFNSTNETDLRIFADGDLIASPSVTSRIGVGNDVISLTNGDSFTLTTADGGPGIDTLDAHNNSGVLLTSGFEIVK